MHEVGLLSTFHHEDHQELILLDDFYSIYPTEEMQDQSPIVHLRTFLQFLTLHLHSTYHRIHHEKYQYEHLKYFVKLQITPPQQVDQY